MRRVAMVLVLGMLTAGCGGGPAVALAHPSSDPASDPWSGAVPDAAALAQWADFPAGHRPRPLLIGSLPLVPQPGFSDGDTKIAVLDGSYELAATLPPDPSPVIEANLPDGRFPLASITARQALDALVATAPTSKSSSAVARITAVTLGTATFPSDRGPLQLPAWLFTVPGANGPLAWPALTASAFWRPATATSVIGSARVSADGLELTVTLPAPSPTTCPGQQLWRYEPASAETPTAVGVGLRRVPAGIAPGTLANCAVPAVLHMADYTVRLSAPLGNRVLLAPIGVGYWVVLAALPAP